MPNTDRFSLLERWADGAEAFAQAVEDKYGPPATPPSLPPYTTYDAMLEAIVDNTVEVKKLINKKSPTYHNTDSAYTKTVPSGDVHYASLEQIGGKTVVWNQIIKCTATATETFSENGIDFTVYTDGSVHIEGTASANATYMPTLSVFDYFPVILGHKYYHYAPTGIVWSDRNGRIGGGNTIVTANISNTQNQVFFRVLSGYTVNVTFYPMVHDLTLMYGAGNEPTTVAEFQQQFPAKYYQYTQGTLLSAGVTSVISKKADTTELATYSIPAEIRALEGYGWSAGTASNYIDFERKKFVKCVDRVDLGTMGYTYQSGDAYFFSSSLYGLKKPGRENIICAMYSIDLSSFVNMINMSMKGNADAGGIYFKNSSYTDGTTFANAMSGVYLYYELATPIETDISAYLTDDNLIEVEAGGSLTFPNSNGADYQIPVPSAETFIVGEP